MRRSLKSGWIITAVVLFALTGCGGDEAINEANDKTNNKAPDFTSQPVTTAAEEQATTTI